jgi:hypothetical protein
MDGTGEHHSEQGYLGSEDQKSRSPLYVNLRSRANTAMWLDLGHMLRRQQIQEV